MNLIRTRLKEKLPQGFSYPVGAEVLSHALENAPQYEQIEIHFSWKDTFWASKYNAKLKAHGDITILEVRYFRGWTIYVHAVPSDHGRKVRELLPVDALPALAEALRNTEMEPQYFGWSVIDMYLMQ